MGGRRSKKRLSAPIKRHDTLTNISCHYKNCWYKKVTAKHWEVTLFDEVLACAINRALEPNGRLVNESKNLTNP